MAEQNSLEKITPIQGEVPATVTVPAYTVDLQEEEQAPSFLDYWRVLRKRRWTVGAILLLVVVTVMIGTLRQTPVYRATAVLQIDRESQNILNFQDFVADIDPWDETYLETFYKLIQSRSLAGRVVEKLQLDQSPEFQKAPSWLDQLWPRAEPQAPEQTAEELALDAKYRPFIDNFLDRLVVTPVRRSRLVQISFDAADPVVSARAVNTLAANFIEMNLEAKWDATQKASDWLSKQLVGLKAKLEKSEEDLQQYAKESSILFLNEKQSLGAEKLQQIQQEATRAEADRIHKESLYEQVRGGDFSAVPGIFENRLYQDLSVRLADLKREYSELAATFTPAYPRVQRLKNQIEEIESILQKEREALGRRVGDEYLAAVNRERLLKQAQAEQTREFNEMAEKAIQYNILQREVETNKELYNGLLQRLKEAGVSAGLRASNIRVVDAAEVPNKPARPQKMLNLALALMVGLTMGVGMALLQEYLDNTLKTPDDVQRTLHLPALGVIPAANASGKGRSLYGYGYGYGYGSGGYGSQKSLPQIAAPEASGAKLSTSLIAADGNAPLTEAYRSLRTSVLLSTSGRPPRLMLITSGQPGEGKTTTAANLAITLAQLGSRVLLIDSDMRRPRVHTLLKLETTPAGLSTFLTGQFNLNDVVATTQIPNLFAIPCGPIPPNPAELQSSVLM
ncbi:MAG: polysaccharide biosynthesis tyrosine autokinase [Acidobacteria bacterium]|nr:polysaccharide biosynthesis tyrosine autokinase [Acidobacteriota bacterium]